MQSKAPFIIQLSKGARNYTDKRMLEAIIRTAETIFPEAIFAVHLDHGDEANLLRLHRLRLLQLGHDRRQPRVLRRERRDHASASSIAPTPKASAWRRSWECSAAWKKTSKSTKGTPA